MHEGWRPDKTRKHSGEVAEGIFPISMWFFAGCILFLVGVPLLQAGTSFNIEWCMPDFFFIALGRFS